MATIALARFRKKLKKGMKMSTKRDSSGIDRRLANNRREADSIGYFLNEGFERRKWEERRQEIERRFGWIKVDKWHSVFPWEIK